MLKAYIPILISSTVSLAAIMALVAMIEPGLFTVVPVQHPITVSSDAAPLQKEESVAAQTNESSDVLPSDSVGIQTPVAADTPARPRASEDSLQSALAPLNVVVKRAASEKESGDTLSVEEKKKMAKIFEAMDAASAARILYNMEDRAVKSILSQMKARQSAKVLAELDPKQAARILNGESQ